MSDHLPAYTADMGEVHYDPPGTVIVAGKPRPGVAWLTPEVEANYFAADRMDENNRAFIADREARPSVWAHLEGRSDG